MGARKKEEERGLENIQRCVVYSKRKIGGAGVFLVDPGKWLNQETKHSRPTHTSYNQKPLTEKT